MKKNTALPSASRAQTQPTQYPFALLLYAVLLCGLLTGCALSQSTPNATLYTLMPQEDALPISSHLIPEGSSVMLGPVTIPSYIDRPQLVTRGINEEKIRVYPHEFHRWAEPLKEHIPRILSQNIARRLGITHQVILFPSRIGQKADYQLAITINRLDGTLGHQATLEAWWTLLDNNTLLASGRINEHIAIGASFDDLVKGESELLCLLIEQILQ